VWINETTASLRRIPFVLYDLTQALQPGQTVTGAEVQVSKNGGAFVNGAGSVVEVGGGAYYYEATAGEVDTEGWLMLKVVNTGSAPGPISTTDIQRRSEDRMAAWVHDTGRTFIGLMGRVEAFISGKATTLNGANAAFFRADGVTVSFTAPQDVTLGNRTAADVSNRP
jgi:hypothetical protein